MTDTLATSENPWLELPDAPPFVAPVDRSAVAHHAHSFRHLLLDYLPVPFMGRADADVVLLALNPGGRTNDVTYGPAFVQARRRSLRFEGDSPFWCLDPAFAHTEGFAYWEARLRLLRELVGRETLERRLLLVQWFPYQSLIWRDVPEVLPSQQFGFELVRDAIRRRATVVLLRSRRLWMEAVPELRRTPVIEVRNPRSPYLTPRNLGAGEFERLLHRLR